MGVQVLVRNNVYSFTSAHCILAFPDGCFWFESNGFKNWTIQNNTLEGCGGGADIFVAACAPNWGPDGLPTSDGNPITVGQPFADGAIVDNRFVQSNNVHSAVQLYGFDGLTITNNQIIAPAAELHAKPSLSTDKHVGLCSGLCSSFDNFDITSTRAMLGGWVVDTALGSNSSSTVIFKVDGAVVATAVANSSRPDLVGPVCLTPNHGFDVKMPPPVLATLLQGNHTLAVYAHRGDGSLSELYGSPKCANKFRRACGAPLDCACGAPLPPRLYISNSIRCSADGNVCDGARCTFDASGCLKTDDGQAAAQTDNDSSASTAAAPRWKQDVFTISEWVPPLGGAGPNCEHEADARYSEFANANFTVLLGDLNCNETTCYCSTGKELCCGKTGVAVQMKLCEKHGLKCVPGRGRVIERIDPAATSSPAFWGFDIKDEPNAREFPMLRNVSDQVAALYPGHLRFINLLPNYASPAQYNASTYSGYVDAFVSQVDPDVICMDRE